MSDDKTTEPTQRSGEDPLLKAAYDFAWSGNLNHLVKFHQERQAHDDRIRAEARAEALHLTDDEMNATCEALADLCSRTNTTPTEVALYEAVITKLQALGASTGGL